MKFRNVLSILSTISLYAAAAAATELSNFNDWPRQRISLPDVSIHLRYFGTGPPLLLVHGFPEHSPTWYKIGPILAQNYTVIAPDLRGMGDSSIPFSYDFTAEAAADDLKAVLDHLKVNETYVFAHDKGTGVATAFTAKNRDMVKRLGLSEYPLPGFGYESFQGATPQTNLYSNWQLNFFSVPDAAQYFIQGREREMLLWYFFHASYSGTSSVRLDLLTTYTDSLAKPGFLRAGLSYFSNQVVAKDAAFFNSTVRAENLEQPVLFLGGEASLGLVELAESLFGPAVKDLEIDIVPKAGHWIADENPKWVAERVAQFLAEDDGIPSTDLSWLTNKVTVASPVI